MDEREKRKLEIETQFIEHDLDEKGQGAHNRNGSRHTGLCDWESCLLKYENKTLETEDVMNKSETKELLNVPETEKVSCESELTASSVSGILYNQLHILKI